ncbi:hypothetical protein [Solidesulfovibrio magneticus]|uniref:Uncharacterized protein n=1 Tax=Solidesulfovibrio magneticus (strain ATCC 700980 / DSM 13731 / RS-1) TaxID=573370 RepID=C4XIG0_SOLM1|nr:hypothetical protein [Solidesulfovibrio magneticus]BAH76535.1 hypothetical protein DMR_30440 [Solidesulfovibrio magneticus RS-1]
MSHFDEMLDRYGLSHDVFGLYESQNPPPSETQDGAAEHLPVEPIEIEMAPGMGTYGTPPPDGSFADGPDNSEKLPWESEEEPSTFERIPIFSVDYDGFD